MGPTHVLEIDFQTGGFGWLIGSERSEDWSEKQWLAGQSTWAPLKRGQCFLKLFFFRGT